MNCPWCDAKPDERPYANPNEWKCGSFTRGKRRYQTDGCRVREADEQIAKLREQQATEVELFRRKHPAEYATEETKLLMEVNAELRRQRDEAVKACKGLAARFMADGRRPPCLRRALAVIARIEGEQR